MKLWTNNKLLLQYTFWNLPFKYTCITFLIKIHSWASIECINKTFLLNKCIIIKTFLLNKSGIVNLIILTDTFTYSVINKSWLSQRSVSLNLFYQYCFLLSSILLTYFMHISCDCESRKIHITAYMVRMRWTGSFVSVFKLITVRDKKQNKKNIGDVIWFPPA